MHFAQKNRIHNITPRLSMQIHSTPELRSSRYPQSARKSKNCIKSRSNAITSLLPASYSDTRKITLTICNLQSCSNTVSVFCNILPSLPKQEIKKDAIHSVHSIKTLHVHISAHSALTVTQRCVFPCNQKLMCTTEVTFLSP